MSLSPSVLRASCRALLLAACGDRQPEQPATTAKATPAAAPTSIEDVELIPRDALFGNPERANVQISPDGKYLSWIAPVDGVLNVWVAPADDIAGRSEEHTPELQSPMLRSYAV